MRSWSPGRGACAAVCMGLVVALVGCEPAIDDPFRDRPELENPTEEGTMAVIHELLPPQKSGPQANRERFLDLMKLSLTDLLYENDPVGRRKRVEGWDWPSQAYTMIGLHRLNNIQECFDSWMGGIVHWNIDDPGYCGGSSPIHNDPMNMKTRLSLRRFQV